MSRVPRAFSLIELLVVITIVALLIAMLLPVLASARENARRAICMSNLHQCGLALMTYAQEHKRFPIPCYEAGTFGNFGGHPVTQLLADTRAVAAAYPGHVDYDMRVGLKSYTNDWRAFFCPSVPTPFDPNSGVFAAFPIVDAAVFSNYVGFFGKVYGTTPMVRADDAWITADGKRHTALMADTYYYGTDENITRLNHNAGRVPVAAGNGPGPSASYFAQSGDYGLLNDTAFWAGTLFTDGSAAGAATAGLSPVNVSWPNGGGNSETHYLVER